MQRNTREKLLKEAEVLFSKKGFYGTSIKDIAAELSISKQGLLHHFASKEKLYAAVLKAAADYLLSEVNQAVLPDVSARNQLLGVVERLASPNERTTRVIKLLMRELLDNPQRAEKAQQWFLGPLLDTLENMIHQAQRQGDFVQVHPLAFVYQLLGALQYYAISIPTLKRLYDPEKFSNHAHHHMLEIQRWIAAINLPTD